MLHRPRAWFSLLVVTAALAVGCTSGDGEDVAESQSPPSEAAAPPGSPEGPPIVVGSANFGESEMVAELYVQALLDRGLKVKRAFDVGPREEYLAAAYQGDLDVVPEYLGSLTEYLNRQVNLEQGIEEPKASGSVEDTLANLDDLLGNFEGWQVAEPARASNQNAFGVTEEYAKKRKLKQMSDLRRLNGKLTAGGPPECSDNEYCLIGLREVYGLKFKELVRLDAGGIKTKRALVNGKVDLALVFTTDPTLDTSKIRTLEDDKELQVAENLTPLLHADVASDEAVAALDDVSAVLRTSDLRQLNGKVQRGWSIKRLAGDWLADQGVIETSAYPKPTAPKNPVALPKPEPEPTDEPDEGGSTPPSTAGGYARNQGEPSAAAQSQNWAGLAQCESGGDPSIVSSNGLYHGLYQFSVSTWQAVGGGGVASGASPEEQTYRAQILWDRAGPGSWPVCQVNL